MDINSLLNLYVDACLTSDLSFDEYLSMKDSVMSELGNGVYEDVVKFIDGVIAEAIPLKFTPAEARANNSLRFELLLFLQRDLMNFSANKSVKVKIFEYFDIALGNVLCQFYNLSKETFKALWGIGLVGPLTDTSEATPVVTFFSKKGSLKIPLNQRLMFFDYMMSGINVYKELESL